MLVLVLYSRHVSALSVYWFWILTLVKCLCDESIYSLAESSVQGRSQSHITGNAKYKAHFEEKFFEQ